MSRHPLFFMTPRSRIPVVLDTDIGTDIDDTWALAQLLRCPELEPRLILTATGDAVYRATVTARFLSEAGRADIPVGLGVNSHPMAENKNQAGWIEGYSLSEYDGEIVEDGVGRLIRIVEESPTPVTIVAIAPAGNLAAALARAPWIAGRCRLVGMFGSFEVGYGGGAPISAETNVRCDPASLRTVLAAPWREALITPLDTCNAVVLDAGRYQRIWSATSDPVLRAVIENYRDFAPRVRWMRCDFFERRSTILFDCVAVCLAYAEELVEVERVRFRITDDGFTLADEAGEFTARLALRWKSLDGFLDHLTETLLGQRMASDDRPARGGGAAGVRG